MPIQHPSPYLNVADYLEGEKYSDIRHEYINGNVYAMSGASDRHNLLAGNLHTLLNLHLPDTCQVFISDMKVHIKSQQQEIFYYPDVMVSCDESDRENYYRDRPCLIVEVLSASTERVDRYEKFLFYQQLESLQEYVLVSQGIKEIQVFRRSRQWTAEIYHEGEIHLESVGLTVSVDAVYRRVRFHQAIGGPAEND